MKSFNHYRAGFAPAAAQIIPLASPGAITPDFANLPLIRRSPNYWPKGEDTFT